MGVNSTVINSVSADQDCDGLIDSVEYFFGSNPRLADSDSDGATDFVEMFQFTNPLNPDTDGDGILDKPEDDYTAAAVGSAEATESVNADDNCPSVYNPTQLNTDGARRANGANIAGEWASNPNQDKAGNACDDDDDNDLASDLAETAATPYTEPLIADTDGDRCLDGAESYAGKNPTDPASKCPTAITAGLQLYFKGCHLNLPGGISAPDFSPGYPTGGTAWVENDIDGDGISCIAATPDTDSDNGTGTGAVALAEILDGTELFGYGTAIARKDTDGDGCEDWIEIMDINGDRKTTVADQLLLAKRKANQIAPSDSDPVFDVNRDGGISVGDQLLMAKNTCSLKPTAVGCSTCPAEN